MHLNRNRKRTTEISKNQIKGERDEIRTINQLNEKLSFQIYSESFQLKVQNVSSDFTEVSVRIQEVMHCFINLTPLLLHSALL